MIYRNATFAFIGELGQIGKAGRPVVVRGKGTSEILARTVTLETPAERFITVPGRGNDVFAAIAETMWVIAGRNDVGFLSRYLKRATQFSDDGLTWRGGYGPRLRNWNGVDQINEVRQLLGRDPNSRRAVAVLFNPGEDFVETADVPCNNWLHFVQREGRLDLNVVVRSNDILWGFSGINTFEWSVLQEMMAFWLGLTVGRATFFISSLHLYDDPERRAQAARSLKGFQGTSGYDRGWSGAPFETRWEEMPAVMEHWFDIEARLAGGADVSEEIMAFPDPLLRTFLQALQVKWAREHGAGEENIRPMIDALGTLDIAYALHEQLFKDSGELPAHLTEDLDTDKLKSSILRLHRMKDASYGNAWKRRGELISIASNLARKVDRLEAVANGAPAGSESLLDTAVDLLVYALKYETYLADHDAEVARSLYGCTGSTFSDGPAGFETVLMQRTFDIQTDDVTVEARQAVLAFSLLDDYLQQLGESWAQKYSLARGVSDCALKLAIAIAKVDWDGVRRLHEEVDEALVG